MAEVGMTIGQVCDELGLSTRTVRYYEELGLLPGVERQASGRRVYGPDELERLRFVQRLKTLGLSLAEIRELNLVYGISRSTEQMLRRLDKLLVQHLGDLEARIAELTDLKGDIEAYRGRIQSRVQALGAAAKKGAATRPEAAGAREADPEAGDAPHWQEGSG